MPPPVEGPPIASGSARHARLVRTPGTPGPSARPARPYTRLVRTPSPSVRPGEVRRYGVRPGGPLVRSGGTACTDRGAPSYGSGGGGGAPCRTGGTRLPSARTGRPRATARRPVPPEVTPSTRLAARGPPEPPRPPPRDHGVGLARSRPERSAWTARQNVRAPSPQVAARTAGVEPTRAKLRDWTTAPGTTVNRFSYAICPTIVRSSPETCINSPFRGCLSVIPLSEFWASGAD